MSTDIEDLTPHDHKDAEHGHNAAGTYLKTLIALLCLTGVTVGAAYIDFGAGNVVIALTIATVKALIVALIFMHLRYEKPVNAVIAGAGFMFLGLFLMFCVIDFDSRENLQPVNIKPVIQSTIPPAPGGAPPETTEEKK
jgi:cytochrome c oxidase subunit 4